MSQRKRQKQKPKQKSTILNLDGQVFKNKEARKKKKPSKLKKTLVNQRKNKEFAETTYYDYTPTLDLDLCVLTFLSKLFKIQTKTKITNTKKKKKHAGSIFKKTLRISMIGVFDKSGADLLFARMLMLAKIERKKERLKLLQNHTSPQLKETETETETETKTKVETDSSQQSKEKEKEKDEGKEKEKEKDEEK
ncbi:hypothetical protein M0813_17269 [Anaeramoeba flamelloides]|uniref:Uncharacterized protein n=1 Tax=Anaeramoeba flamelloides TaxID=1746091 RepID=A0ABQ8YVW0_9EUKA|nr:hypothetical protein M0813_17269 [Anaeramoeba flamelloides]